MTTHLEAPADTDRLRPWCRLNADQFHTMLSSSSLCQSDAWPANVDKMAAMYDDKLNNSIDQLIPS